MATVTEHSDDYIRRLNRETAQLEAETRRLVAEAARLHAERMRADMAQTWLDRLIHRPLLFMAFTLVLSISIMGLGGALVLAPKFLS